MTSPDDVVPSTTPQVLISHALRDGAAAEELARALELRGIDVLHPRDIPWGTSIEAGLRSMLDRADAVVVIVSDDALSPERLDSELAIAMELEKVIVPVAVGAARVPPLLAPYQGARLTWSKPRINELADQLATQLGRTRTSATGDATASLRIALEDSEARHNAQLVELLDRQLATGFRGAGWFAQGLAGLGLLVDVAAVVSLIMSDVNVLVVGALALSIAALCAAMYALGGAVGTSSNAREMAKCSASEEARS